MGDNKYLELYVYVVDIACIVGGKAGVLYLVYQIRVCSVGCHWRLLVTITPLLRSMCGSGILWCLTGTCCC